jgi:type I restriction enzyme, S subunit
MADQAKRDVLISIQPQYVEKILDGTKRYEYRKVAPEADAVNDFYIYESSPTRKIVASFPATEIFSGTPEKIWEMSGDRSGGTSEGFFQYFKDKKIAYAIAINGLRKAKWSLNPYELFQPFRAPESYMFVQWDRCKLEKERFGSRFEQG